MEIVISVDVLLYGKQVFHISYITIHMQVGNLSKHRVWPKDLSSLLPHMVIIAYVGTNTDLSYLLFPKFGYAASTDSPLATVQGNTSDSHMDTG